MSIKVDELPIPEQVKGMFKENDIEPNAAKCDKCGRQRAHRVNGKIIQPCPDCELQLIHAKEQTQAHALISRSQYKDFLDEKYRDVTFKDLKAPNETLSRSYNRCHWWADNFKRDYWIVLSGNQGTGKGQIKNAILKTLGGNGHSFINTTAWEMWQRYNEHTQAGKSLIELRDYYCSADLLSIDEIGRTSETAPLKNFLFQVVDTIYNNNKGLMLISNLLLKGKNDDEGATAIGSYIDLDRVREKAMIVPFPGESLRKPDKKYGK